MDLKHRKPTKLFWVDLEMTGLDVETEVITEAAVLISDFKLNLLNLNSDGDKNEGFEAVIHYSEGELKQKFDSEESGFWNSLPKERDKLIEACASSRLSLRDVEDSLIKIVEEFFNGEPVILAGNSIRMDRMFIDKYMPRFAALLHYRMFDVSTLKIWIEGNNHPARKKLEKHRALYDIYESIEELRYYLKKGWMSLEEEKA